MKRAISRKNLWEGLPAPVKVVAGAVMRPVPPSWLLGRSFRRWRRFVEEAQWWSKSQAEAYQLARVRDMCELAYTRSEFYREHFDSAGILPKDLMSLDELHRLPTIDKKTNMANLEGMCVSSISNPGVDYVTTGGTSGQPLRFYIPSSRSAVEYAHLTSSWQRAGYTLGMPMAVLSGRQIRAGRDGLHREYLPMLRHHYYSTFHLREVDLRAYVKHMRKIGPFVLHAYPSAATTLVRYLRGIDRRSWPSIRCVLLESENVYENQRNAIEQMLGVRVFSSYGHSEKLVMAAECEYSSDYHVWPTYGYCELLDDRGHPVTTPGQRGEIVGTGFINDVMPFIRYRTGDYATYVGEACSACGRQHMVVRNIRGHRIQESLVTRDGSEISWTAMNMHDDTFDHVRQFQFYQDTPGMAVLRIVPGEGFNEKNEQLILRNLDQKLHGQITVTCQVVDAIRLTNRGKAIYVDQAIKGRSGAEPGGLDGGRE